MMGIKQIDPVIKLDNAMDSAIIKYKKVTLTTELEENDD